MSDELPPRHPRSVRGRPRGRQRAASRVLDQLRMAIRNELPPDYKFDEPSLVTELGASRTAVREALQQLMRDGLVSRRPALGTVLTTTIHDIPLQTDGPDPRVIIDETARDVVPAHPHIAKLLGTDDTTLLCVRHRFSTVDGPLGLRAAYQRTSHEPGPKDHGIGLRTISTVVSGTRAGADLALALGLAPEATILVRERLLVDDDGGAPRQVAFSHYRGDRVAFMTGGPGSA